MLDIAIFFNNKIGSELAGTVNGIERGVC